VIDITNLIRQWLLCSSDLWMRWFKDRENGADEFISIEEALLDVMVIQKLGLDLKGVSTDTFIKQLRVKYVFPVDDIRQLCIKQHAGNIYCSPKSVTIPDGSIQRVKAIDTMGTMLNDKPYVEVVFGKGFILESPDALDFLFEPTTYGG
jgi:hypothetical protein